MKKRASRFARRNVLLALGWNVTEFNQGVFEYAKKANWIVNDIMSHNGRVPAQWNGDGIITGITESSEKALLRLLVKAKVPVVNLASYSSPIINCRILPDNKMIGAVAAEHLLSRGFQQFAFYRVSSFPTVMERMVGFRSAILAAGKEYHELDLSTQMPAKLLNSDQYLTILSALVSKLKKLPKPIGVMAQYDAEANDVVRACLSVNLRIPEDVAVIGVDNDPLYSTLGPVPLTSVNSNRRLAGYRAAEMLDSILDGKRWGEKLVLIKPEGVVVRESTDLVAVGDPYVSKALRYILSEFKSDIDVEDVVKRSGISRRGLYSRFEKNVGHTIYEEIMNHRLDYASRLLRETDAKLHAVALNSGFGDSERLSKAFKRHYDISPIGYRLQQRAGVD